MTPARSRAKVNRRVPPGQESPGPEKQELYQSSRMERHSQGTRAGSQEGQWRPQAPGVTNRGPAPWGRASYTAAPERAGARRAGSWEESKRLLGQRLHVEGAALPQEHNSSGAGPGAQGTGGHSPGHQRSGGHRAARTLLLPGAPRCTDWCHPHPPTTWSIQASAV